MGFVIQVVAGKAEEVPVAELYRGRSTTQLLGPLRGLRGRRKWANATCLPRVSWWHTGGCDHHAHTQSPGTLVPCGGPVTFHFVSARGRLGANRAATDPSDTP